MPRLGWDGKEAVVNYDKRVPIHLLDEVPELAIPGDPAKPTHTLIEGDNLLALKALMPRYKGRVKCVYIDPPYNTGNEGWVYNDNVNNPLVKKFTDWVGKEVGKDDLSRHDKWLCFMYPRLVLLRDLLSEDGVICLSMDDTEAHHLRVLLDEIFSENGYVCTVVWQKRYVSNVTAKWLSDMHDFVFVYSKNRNQVKVAPWARTNEQLEAYKNKDDDARGAWRAQDLSASKPYNAGQFPISGPTGKIFSPPPGRYWRCNERQFKEWDADNRIWWGRDRTARPMLKVFLHSASAGVTPHTWWDYGFAGHNKEATLELKDMFDGASPFDTPKPVKLVRRILESFTTPDSIVLDAFAGACTTGHAVMELNRADGGRRECLLIQLGHDQADGPNIAGEIGRERLLRASGGFTKPSGEVVGGLNQAWRYCRLGQRFVTPGLTPAEIPFGKLAPLAFFHATGETPPGSARESAYLGTSSDGTAVILLYNGDMEDKDPAGQNALNRATWARIKRHLDGAKRMVVFCTGIAGVASLIAEHEVRIEQWPQCFERLGE